MLSVLDIDPDLGAGLPPEAWATARTAASGRTLRLRAGRWEARDLGDAMLLVADGLLLRELRLGGRVASELVGPGDVIDPALLPDELVPAEVGWRVVTETRAVVLTVELVAAVPPVVARNLLGVATRRASRLATAQAIAQLPRVDDRVLALFGHLAERWGHVTPAGVRLPLTLTHETIGQLLGAARPTVSLALKGLAQRGEVVPQDPGWLLATDALERLRPRPVLRSVPAVTAVPAAG